ncbi:MAG: outer membrane lipoprotein-sorting protein, partial [Desulfosalsimonas sp.]
SESRVRMTIHRPDWERTMTINVWTEAMENSIFWIVSPPKDRGNGTLKRGDEMWIYNPKVNRVIKLPPSMMSQSWQGSDFSNNDLAKSGNIVDQYTHEIIGTETHQDKTVYVIRSLPKPGAPVVWGMQKLKIREDHILLRQGFFDEDEKLVKAMTMEKIEMLGDRLYPVKWKMQKAGQKEEYTVLDYQTLEFDVDISDRMFTIARLKNPRL